MNPAPQKKRAIATRKGLFLAFAACFVALFFLAVPPRVAHGGLIEIGAEAVGFVTYYITYAIGYIAGILFKIGGGLVSVAIDLNGGILNSKLVAKGFEISLSVTNLGFVLAIIVIAFATMLRIQTYGIKRMISRLILAVFLVNFSLTIAGAFLDFSGVITKYFLSVSTGNNPQLMATNLASTFNANRYLEANPVNEPGDISKKVKDTLVAIGGMFFTALFTLLGAIALVGIAAMILARYVTLSILLILMPFAWLGLVLPGAGGWWRKWWHNFLNWIFFMPVAIFFFYLSVVSVNTTTGIRDAIVQSAVRFEASSGSLGALTAGLADYANMVVAIMLLLGGLSASRSMGIAGASATLGFATALKTGFIGKPGAMKRWAEKRAENVAGGVARLPILRTLLRPVSAPVREKIAKLKEENVANTAELTESMKKRKVPVAELQKMAGPRWNKATWKGWVPGKRRKFLVQRAAAINVLAEQAGGQRIAPDADEYAGAAFTGTGPTLASWQKRKAASFRKMRARTDKTKKTRENQNLVEQILKRAREEAKARGEEPEGEKKPTGEEKSEEKT